MTKEGVARPVPIAAGLHRSGGPESKETEAHKYENERLAQELRLAREVAQQATSKMKLATAARENARAVERDYDEVVALLEAEIAHLRSQLLAGPDEKDQQLINLRRRCIILGVQLNKAVKSKEDNHLVLRRQIDLARRTKMRLTEASQRQRTADTDLNLRADGTIRHRPSDGPLPPSATWKVGDLCRVPSANAGGQVLRAVIQEVCTLGRCLGRRCLHSHVESAPLRGSLRSPLTVFTTVNNHRSGRRTAAAVTLAWSSSSWSTPAPRPGLRRYQSAPFYP